MQRLAELQTSRENNFNLLRLIAALLVIFSHSYSIALGNGSSEPLRQLLGVTFGSLAVDAFFFISGYLVLQSWQRQGDLTSFCRARLLRVLPALAGVLLFSIALGIFFSSLPLAGYLAESDTWKYFYKNLLMLKTEYSLPGVFLDVPYPDVINGSLWTLRYEMKMYLGLAVLGLLGLLSRKGLRLFLIAYLAWYAFSSWALLAWPKMDVSAEMLRLSFCFVLGGACAHYARYLILRLEVCLLLVVGVWLSVGTPLFQTLISLLIGYGVLYLAYVPKGWLLQYNRLGDYSYGTYLYAFPIQQALVALMPGVQPWSLTIYAALLTLVCAICSWHLIEKPALNHARRRNAEARAQRIQPAVG
jgi:peptidoglycan/LPS O-acetylase OafA/YrhL